MNNFPVSLDTAVFSPSLPMRLLRILPAALVTTFSLLYAMYYLVHNEYPLQLPKPTPPIPEVIMNIPRTIPIIIEELPVRPIEQLPPPVINTTEPLELQVEPGLNFNEPPVAVKPPIDPGFGFTGQLVPIIRVAPQYPQAAVARGVEGYVDIMFDVTAMGTTENIRILEAVPSSVFNRSVMKAVKGWRYKPNVVDGVPVSTPNVRDRVRFNIEK